MTQMRTLMTPAEKQRVCDRWNKQHPVGTRVRFWKGRAHDGKGELANVEEPGAFLLGGHTPVVKVPGDAISITHVEVVN